MAATLHDLLQPMVVLDVVSRIRKGQGRLGRWFKFHYNAFDAGSGSLTGPAVTETPTRSGTYRIFDRTRTVAKGRAPGTGPAWWQPQPVGEVPYTCARFHEKIQLNAEELTTLSKIIGPNTVVDAGGQDYLSQQEKYIADRFNNAVEVLTGGLIRGKLYLKNVGEDWIPVWTQPSAGTPFVTIDFQVPSGNLGQLNMLGAGAIIDLTWLNPAAKIMSKHLPGIEQAFVQLHGYPLRDIWVDSITWSSVITNTEVINTAGSANTPFESFDYVGEKGNDGYDVSEQVAVLRGRPYLRWHILNDVLALDGTDPSYAGGTASLAQEIPTNTALFLPELEKELVDIIQYGEYISDAPGQPMVKRPGFYLYAEWTTQPTAVELIGLLNAIPRLKAPKILALGTVIF